MVCYQSHLLRVGGAGLNKIRYWLLLKMAEMPRLFAFGIGLLLALVLVSGALVATVWLDQRRISQQHEDTLRTFQKVAAESTELLDRLVALDDLRCSEQGLISLNSYLLGTRYLREIGLLDDERRLTCSTALGALYEHIKGNYPVHITDSGAELLVNVPLTMAGKKQSAIIVQRPRVNVVVSPYVTDDLYASADVVWLRTRAGLILLHARTGIEQPSGMKVRAAAQDATRLTWRGLSYELISMTPGLDVVLQTQRSLLTIVRHDMLLPVFLPGLLLIAALAIGASTPYVQKLGRLSHRIRFLCDDAHLMLLYQPIFDLQTMRPIGCEVLARLKEGDKTWAPDQMIPAILRKGLERSFDHAVMRKAIRELAEHLPQMNQGKFSVALNCFPQNIEACRLIPLLANALEDCGRKDFEICIEVTEHSLSSELITEVQQLKAHGFLIAVDDFGTGYSNLKTVTQLSPEILKIDRSFVYEVEDGTVRSSLIPEIVRIASAVNALTVAEGIEKIEQAKVLLSEGVRYGQGYALGRPMNINAFINFFVGESPLQ